MDVAFSLRRGVCLIIKSMLFCACSILILPLDFVAWKLSPFLTGNNSTQTRLTQNIHQVSDHSLLSLSLSSLSM